MDFKSKVAGSIPAFSGLTFSFNNSIDAAFNFLYSGVDWIYIFTESVYCYDFKLWYFKFYNSIFDNSFNFFFEFYWFFNLNFSVYQLFFSILLDYFLINSLFTTFFTDEWFRTFLMSQASSINFIIHPELLFYIVNYNNFNVLTYFTNFFIIHENFLQQESFFSFFIIIPQFLFYSTLILFFISFYFSYFNTPTKEEVTVDYDFLTASATVESEKELGSFDDIIMALPILFIIFGWYFFNYVWCMFSEFPEIALVFYIFPLLYILILCIPSFLWYDFGIYFLSYLRGVGPTPVIFLELLYDYIALLAFYIRLIVQGVRLLLMFFTYASLHDLILYFNWDQIFFINNSILWEDTNNLLISHQSISYFILFTIPSHLLYWLYELLHVFFVVTAQFIAFFAMVFWLFLFLYSFFVIEKFENYFFLKRQNYLK